MSAPAPDPFPDFEAYRRRSIRDLRAYDEEHVGGLNLANNANLFGTNPAIAKGLADAAERVDDLWNYPSLTSVDFREEAARAYGIDAAGIVTGNGSNELIDVMMRAFCEPGEAIAFHDPTFSMIPVFARVNGVTPRPVPLDREWHLDAAALAKEDARITFIVTPNNPTGNTFPTADVRHIVEHAPGIVVVDEAYGEFAPEGSSFLPLVSEYPNLIVLRTLSKAHGLAGFRIGFMAAQAGLAQEVAKVRGPFKLNVVSERVGIHALRDDTFLKATVAGVARERPGLTKGLESRGFTVYPSSANFILTKPPVDAAQLATALGARGVHVRDFGGALAPYLRVSVGPKDKMDTFFKALDDALPEVRT